MYRELKYLLVSAFVIIASGISSWFYFNMSYIDIFPFSDHTVSVEVLVCDSSYYFALLCFSYFLTHLSRKVFFPVFIYVILSTLSYFLFHSGTATNYTIPFYFLHTLYQFRTEMLSLFIRLWNKLLKWIKKRLWKNK